MKIETKTLYNACTILLSVAFVLLVFNFFLSNAHRRYDSFDNVKFSVTEKNSYQKENDSLYYIKLSMLVKNGANYPLDNWKGIMTVKNKDDKELCRMKIDAMSSFSDPDIEVGHSRNINITIKYSRMDNLSTEFYLADKDALIFEFEPTEVAIRNAHIEYLQAETSVYSYTLNKMFPLSIISIPINALLFGAAIFIANVICKKISRHFEWED